MASQSEYECPGGSSRTSASRRRGPWSQDMTCLTALVLTLVVVCFPGLHASDLTMDAKFKINVERLDDLWPVSTFPGNATAPDYFKLLFVEGDSAMVGARNFIYNISLRDLTENDRIAWFSTKADVTMCRLWGKSAEQCQNYIRTIVRKSATDILVCGTNAYRPLCRTYRYDPVNGYSHDNGVSGVAYCPYNPLDNSTAIYVDNSLYSATVSDNYGRDPLIFRQPMRTEQHDSQWLNEPNFISSFDYEDKVYFFFRETAVEFINCGKTVYSRIARICKNDMGGSRLMSDTWTSFFKARLNCSIPGDFPFYFNELQSTSKIRRGNYMPTIHDDNTTDLVYAVFTTPENSIHGSAVCAFSMNDVLLSFEGPFKAQTSYHTSWLPVNEMDTPQPHPAKACANDSHSLSDQTLNFIKSHPLMDRTVPSQGGAPLFIQASFDYRFTQIAVHWHVLAANNKFYDVIFVGTDHGHVLKMVNVGSGGHIQSVLVEDIEVFGDARPILGLEVYIAGPEMPPQQHRLKVVGRDDIKAIPLHRCQLQTSCSSCVALQDPYCSWVSGECQFSTEGFQNLEDGLHRDCPASPESPAPESTSTPAPTTTPCACMPIDPEGGDVPQVTTTGHGAVGGERSNEIDDDYQWETDRYDDNMIPVIPEAGMAIGENTTKQYSASDMAIAIVLTLLFALVIGGFAGYWFSSWRQQKSQLRFIDRDRKLDPESKNLKFQENSNVYNHIDNSTYSAPPEKQRINVVISSLRPGNNGKLPNGSAESKPVPPQGKGKKVYL